MNWGKLFPTCQLFLQSSYIERKGNALLANRNGYNTYHEKAIKGDKVSSEYMPVLTAFCSETLHKNVLQNIAFHGYSDIQSKIKTIMLAQFVYLENVAFVKLPMF